MKSLKYAKFQVSETFSTIIRFYIIFILIFAFVVIISSNTNGSASSSGIEFASVVFLFVTGLNSFKSGFKFSQANNVSRKTFFKGLIIGVFPVTLTMSVIDIILNRVYNIFAPCPTNYDMVYGVFRGAGNNAKMLANADVLPLINSFSNILGTVIWQFALYSMVFIAGILISAVYYRSNKPLKILVSVSPVILTILLRGTEPLIPSSFWTGLAGFIAYSFGWQTQNPFMAVFTFAITGAIISSFLYLLIRRAVVKE